MTTPTTHPNALLELGSATVIEHVSGQQTSGAFATLEFRVQSGGPTPPAHVHEREDEFSYVIEGALEVTVGDTTRQGRAWAQTIFKPRASRTASLSSVTSPCDSSRWSSRPGSTGTSMTWPTQSGSPARSTASWPTS